MPLYFEPNQAAAGSPVAFLARGRGYAFVIGPSGATLCTGGDGEVALNYEGGAAASVDGADPNPGRVRYFLGEARGIGVDAAGNAYIAGYT